MRISYLNRVEQPLLRRTTLLFEISFEGGIPSRGEVTTLIQGELSDLNGFHCLDSFETTFGKRVIRGRYKIYSEEDSFNRLEKVERLKVEI